jgi:hypothetical protein
LTMALIQKCTFGQVLLAGPLRCGVGEGGRERKRKRNFRLMNAILK